MRNLFFCYIIAAAITVPTAAVAEWVGNDPSHSAPVGDNVVPGSIDSDGDVIADPVDVCPFDGAPGYKKPEPFPGDEIVFAPGLGTDIYVVSVDAAVPEEDGTVTILDCATEVVLNYGDFYWTEDRQYQMWLGRIFTDRAHFVVWNNDADGDGVIDCTPPAPPVEDPCEEPCSLDSLMDWVDGLTGVPNGIINALGNKLDQYESALAAGNTNAAAAHLQAFINQINALSGVHLDPAEVATITDCADLLLNP